MTRTNAVMGRDPKAKIKIRQGHWNVRTTYETSKLAQVVISEMRNFRLHVLGVSERMEISTRRNALYSGRDDDHHYRPGEMLAEKSS